jgi:hypothetical protein
MKKIVIASHNQGKIVEIKDLLMPLGYEVLSSNDFNIEEPEETGETFIDNAYIKSKAFQMTQAWLYHCLVASLEFIQRVGQLMMKVSVTLLSACRKLSRQLLMN